jgi:hypothetical protein
MSSVYFDPAVGGDGTTITDDSNPSTGLANGGHRTRYVPSLANIVSVGNFSLTQANSAAASAVTANNWAVLTGGPVSGGEYSAKYHAQDAASSAGSAAGSATLSSNWAVQLGTPVSGGEYSAKYHAQAASSSATLANSWATQMATPVSGGEYSAKYHATAAASSAAAAASSAGSLVMPTIIAADAGRGIKVNGAGNGWVLDLRVLTVSYDNRADLRSTAPSDGDFAMVDGLGLFRYAPGVDEGPDDDETAFQTATGYWLLICPSWDVVDAYTLAAEDYQEARIDSVDTRLTSAETRLTSAETRLTAAETRLTAAETRLTAAESFTSKMFRATSTQSAFSVALKSSTTFTVTVTGAVVGASVIATPPSDPTLCEITVSARVSAANTVTVYIGNGSSTNSGGFGAGDWQFTIINQE